MTAPEIQWVFDTLNAIVDETSLAWGTVADVPDGAVPVRRVDRNDSDIHDGGGINSRRGELTKSNYISAALEDDVESHGGFGDDYNAEAIVSLRVEGLTRRGGNMGHVDPDGDEGIVFDEFYGAVRDVLRENDRHPNVIGRSYHTLFLENGTNRSSNYSDFYEFRLDCRFDGYADA